MSDKTVAIITRTKNRPLTLSRLYKNLSQQHYKDFIWVIVNDGGDKSHVNGICEQAQMSGINVKVIHNVLSLGRSKAANIGIQSINAEYVMLLDDDDTLSAMCLEQEVAFLESNKYRFRGVFCWVKFVYERINDKIEFVHDNECHVVEPNDMTLIRIFANNQIMTCGFLYAREIWEKIGGYPEHIDYTEDWYFNVQFLLLANVGIIPHYLANCHKRIQDSSMYKNTTGDFESIWEHKLSALAWRNQLIRDLEITHPVYASALVNYTTHIEQIRLREQFIAIENKLYKIRVFLNCGYKISGLYYLNKLLAKIKSKVSAQC